MDQPRGQLLRVFRLVPAAAVHAEIQQRSELLGVGHTIGKLALDRDWLELAGDLLKNKRGIGTGEWDNHDGRHRNVIEERKPGALPLDLALAVVNYILCRGHSH